MKLQDRPFTVVMYANEYKQICAWVLKNRFFETGGDLFGLWAGDRTAVVQLVLGPGKGCRRTSTSFYQDVSYLEKVGTQLTEAEGICHIGEWHSHHAIGLKEPSGGDQGTVWRNMPSYGLNRFLLFIANIESLHCVSVGSFLFEFDRQTNRALPVLQGKFQLLPHQSPFRQLFIPPCSRNPDDNILLDGAECTNTEDEIASWEEYSRSEDEICEIRPIMFLNESRVTCRCVIL